MKLFISFILSSIFLTLPANANFLSIFLKEAAIKNGYKLPKEINNRFDENKAIRLSKWCSISIVLLV